MVDAVDVARPRGCVDDREPRALDGRSVARFFLFEVQSNLCTRV